MFSVEVLNVSSRAWIQNVEGRAFVRGSWFRKAYQIQKARKGLSLRPRTEYHPALNTPVVMQPFVNDAEQDGSTNS